MRISSPFSYIGILHLSKCLSTAKIENAEKSRSASEPYKINVPCLAHRILFSYMLRSVEGMSVFAIELIETVNITSAYLLQYLLFALHAIPAENPQFS